STVSGRGESRALKLAKKLCFFANDMLISNGKEDKPLFLTAGPALPAQACDRQFLLAEFACRVLLKCGRRAPYSERFRPLSEYAVKFRAPSRRRWSTRFQNFCHGSRFPQTGLRGRCCRKPAKYFHPAGRQRFSLGRF